ncbi:MerR family transcriptional regulator [Subtercola endophyticus]|uniref:MerR family transcriptional regulator n=1 Tax=Subtercola endophyticus TaxID=2895559 RepID=UPI001E303DB6|nr:MerR family transcriptional regulator [Subtercola endophyticus]UFS59428.1 MerR family transcriptional regulator [Subtercola endophyticus]
MDDDETHDLAILSPTTSFSTHCVLLLHRRRPVVRLDNYVAAAAQVIRRFRDVNIPLDEIAAVIRAPNLVSRDRLINAHLQRLQNELTATQAAVASLSDLLLAPVAIAPNIRHHSIPPTRVAAITATVGMAEVGPWWQGALGELRASLRAQNTSLGLAGGMFAHELFTDERGLATMFVPVEKSIAAVGRITEVVLPGVELATIVHDGSPSEIDRSYGALATYVAEHAIGVEGPIREYYLIGADETSDRSAWRTEIGWPIFRTHADQSD